MLVTTFRVGQRLLRSVGPRRLLPHEQRDILHTVCLLAVVGDGWNSWTAHHPLSWTAHLDSLSLSLFEPQPCVPITPRKGETVPQFEDFDASGVVASVAEDDDNNSDGDEEPEQHTGRRRRRRTRTRKRATKRYHKLVMHGPSASARIPRRMFSSTAHH